MKMMRKLEEIRQKLKTQNHQALTLSPIFTHQIDRHNQIVWLSLLLLVALRRSHSHGRLCHRLDLALRLRSGSMLLSRRTAFHRMRLLASAGRLVPLPGAVSQVGAAIGGLVAGLKRQLKCN